MQNKQLPFQGGLDHFKKSYFGYVDMVQQVKPLQGVHHPYQSVDSRPICSTCNQVRTGRKFCVYGICDVTLPFKQKKYINIFKLYSICKRSTGNVNSSSRKPTRTTQTFSVLLLSLPEPLPTKGHRGWLFSSQIYNSFCKQKLL